MRPGEGNGPNHNREEIGALRHDTLPPATEHVQVPDEAVMDTSMTDLDPGEVLLELDMVGTDNRRLVVAMSGTVSQVAADLDTMMAALEDASRRMAERELLDPSFGGCLT